MTAINYVRHLSGGCVGAARLGSVLLASLGALARCPASPCRPRVAQPGPLVPAMPTMAVSVGVYSMRSWLSACRRRVDVLMMPFPPCGGCEAAVRGGEVGVQGSVAPKVQTTSAKNAENRVLWARWSAMWAQRRLASRGARARPPEHVR